MKKVTIKEQLERLRIIKNRINRSIKEGVYTYYEYDMYKKDILNCLRFIKQNSKSQATKNRADYFFQWITGTEIHTQ
jgi:hypothetical protein